MTQQQIFVFGLSVLIPIAIFLLAGWAYYFGWSARSKSTDYVDVHCEHPVYLSNSRSDPTDRELWHDYALCLLGSLAETDEFNAGDDVTDRVAERVDALATSMLVRYRMHFGASDSEDSEDVDEIKVQQERPQTPDRL